MYLKELGELVRSGDSWREGIAVFQKRYDNIPLLVGAEQDAAADLESAKPHATGLSIRATGEEKRGSSRSPANEIMKWIKPAMQRTESSQTLHSSELRRMMQHGDSLGMTGRWRCDGCSPQT